MSKQIEELTAFKTPDGEIFEDFDKAASHYDDLLGLELDGLLKLFNLSCNRRSEHRSLLNLLDNKEALNNQITLIYKLLNHNGA